MGLLVIEGGIDALAHLDEKQWMKELLFLFSGPRYKELEQAITELNKIKRLIDTNQRFRENLKTLWRRYGMV